MTINHNTISSTVTLSNCLEPQSININHHNNYYNNDNYKNDNKSSTIAETNNSSTFFPSSELSINLDKVYKKATQSPVVLTTFELALKRTEKHSSSVTELRHKPYIPSQLGPNRLDDWLSTVAFFPSEKYNNNKSKKEQTKFNLSNKMIDSTAAYRAGEQLYGWINTESEEYLLKKSEDSKTEELSIISCGGDFLFFDPILPIKDSNLRIDENRPKLGRSSSSRGKTTINGKSPSAVLEDSRRCLTALLTVKRETKL